MFRVLKCCLLTILAILLFQQTSHAQISGVPVQSPPLTHALIDEGQFLLGTAFQYSKIENPPFLVDDITPTQITTTQQFGFLAYALSEGFAVGVSNSSGQIRIEGTRLTEDENDAADATEDLDIQTDSNKTLVYLIPTLFRFGKKNRVALIWGKGQGSVDVPEELDETDSSYTVGTTGLVSEIFLMDSFSIIPWATWNYLLFDIIPPSTRSNIGTPDYGLEGVLHLGSLKFSVTLILQAVDTASSLSNDDDDEPEDSDSENATSTESYQVALSFTF